MRHWIWPLVLVLVVALGLDFASDLWIRPRNAAAAEGWDFTATIVAVLCLLGLVVVFLREGGWRL